jgi:hypothetical protein
VDSTQLNELPILTRTNAATAYLREIPGSAPDVSTNFNGQRVTDVVNQIDGVTAMDAGNNGVNYSYSTLLERRQSNRQPHLRLIRPV